MTIILRGDVYHYEFVSDGLRYRGTTGTSNPAKARQVEAVERERARMAGVFGDTAEKPTVTLDQAVTAYIDAVTMSREHVLASSRTKALLRLRRLLKHLGPTTLVCDLTEQMVLAYRATILKGRKRANGTTVRCSPGTANRSVSMLLAVLNYSKRALGAPMVVPDVKALPYRGRRDRVVEGDEEQRLLAACTGDLRDLAIVLLDSGARQSEALSLTWDDIDFQRGVVAIDTRKRHEVAVRRIPMTKRVREVLERRKVSNPSRVWPWSAEDGTPVEGGRQGRGGSTRKQHADRGLVTVTLTSGAKVFEVRLKVAGKAVYIGRHATREAAVRARVEYERSIGRAVGEQVVGLRQQWRAALKRAGIKGLGVHALRHSFATRIARKMPVQVVAAALGHSDVTTSMRYVSVGQELIEQAVRGLEDS